METTTIDYIKLLQLVGLFAVFLFRRFLICLPELLYWWFKDIKNFDRDLFRPFGCWFYVGKQGSGKSMSLVNKLEQLRKRYPKVKIYTNMGYKFETAPLKSLNDLLDRKLYNGKFGTINVTVLSSVRHSSVGILEIKYITEFSMLTLSIYPQRSEGSLINV